MAQTAQRPADSAAASILLAVLAGIAGAALMPVVILLGLGGWLGTFAIVPLSVVTFLVGLGLLIGRKATWVRVAGALVAGASLAAAICAPVLLIRGHG